MKRKHKPVTKELIRHYFGRDAKIHGFAGHYRVTTPMGGEVSISPDKIKLIYGGDDVYRAVVLLIGHCWGSAKAGQGSREFMLASIAHGEAWGVNIQPDFSDEGSGLARWCVAFLVYIIGCAMLPKHSSDMGPFMVLLLAVAVFFVMGGSRKKEQRKLETSGFIYPRQAHGAEYADDEQLRKGGLI
jgi:hypothetical protein